MGSRLNPPYVGPHIYVITTLRGFHINREVLGRVPFWEIPPMVPPVNHISSTPHGDCFRSTLPRDCEGGIFVYPKGPNHD